MKKAKGKNKNLAHIEVLGFAFHLLPLSKTKDFNIVLIKYH